jgi:VWFA-related protein
LPGFVPLRATLGIMRTLPLAVLLLAAGAAVAQEQDPQQEFSETIDVVRYALDVRVTDSWGRAIADLKPEDFIVRIGKKAARVESASWIAEGRNAVTEQEPEKIESADDIESLDELSLDDTPDERSIVILVETDFSRVSGRVLGQMHFNKLSKKILAMLGPHDRVAVLSHDSQLKFRHDFTYDHKAILKAINDSLYIDIPPAPDPSTTGATLSYMLDADAMKKAANNESALLVIAKALAGIGGPKMIILASWGIGELQGRAGVQVRPAWHEAVGILHANHIPVISLDTGLQAQLWVALEATANATGGFYASVQSSPDQMLTRMEGALAGHYELTLRFDDELKPGQHALDIRVNRKGLEVNAPSFVMHAR